MALVSRIYFNAVFGALGGLLGWMLFGVFGDKNVPDSERFLFSPVFWQLGCSFKKRYPPSFLL